MSKTALVVAISDYRRLSKNLPGARTDFEEWGALLSDFGYAVTPLLNEQATKRAILRGVAELLRVPGDEVVIVFAGHGCRALVDSKTKLSEGVVAFLPDDVQPSDYLAFVIFDFELPAIVALLGAGTRLTIFLDCCYAGGLGRVDALATAATTPQDVDRFVILPTPTGEAISSNAEDLVLEQLDASDDCREPLIVAAAGQRGGAFESHNLETGKAHGYFSFFATRVLRAQPSFSAIGLRDSIRAIIAAFHPDQLVTVDSSSCRESDPLFTRPQEDNGNG
ncbi:MAG TPA: caspase family protein [Thermoanaerobaculia bacterium]|nr:caspase family protein [Thermoanaerobaculia bacterium]